MTKIIILLCCVGAGLSSGIYLKRKIIRQNLFWKDCARYAEMLKLNVTGKQLEIAKFNAEFLQHTSEDFSDALKNGVYPPLKTMQKHNVEQFFGNLDCESADALLSHLDFYQKQFCAELAESDEAVKKSSLFVKLGLLFGAMAGILFL